MRKTHLRLFAPARRTPISKGTRLRVFRFDDYTCQYCGAQAPDVPLEVDHILPVAFGGTNARDNPVTACSDCNRGKHDSRGFLPARRHRAHVDVLTACEVEMQAALDDPAFWPGPLVDVEPIADPLDVAWLNAHCGPALAVAL